tara:strand:+ start:657 stop:1073 length:417 start_codon:yes stop_codon:yes gene_type:complete
MSLESKIEALTAAVTALTAQLQAGNVAPAAPVVITSAAPAAPQTVTVQPAPAPVVAAPVVAMPAPPTFMAAPAPAPVGAPFSDPKGLITYVMGAYTALGPQKGSMIQGVLTGLGYQNINDVKPEHYGQLFAGVEALKA